MKKYFFVAVVSLLIFAGCESFSQSCSHPAKTVTLNQANQSVKSAINNHACLIDSLYLINDSLANVVDSLANIIDTLNFYSPSYKVFTGLLTQTGTSFPLITELKYDFAGTYTSSYSNVGEYYIQFSDTVFPDLNKVWVTIFSLSPTDGYIVSFVPIDFHSCYITTQLSGVNSNDALFNTPFEIRVYN